jgi:hypothetical protein
MEHYLEEQGVTDADVAWWEGLSWLGKKQIKASENAYVGAWLEQLEQQGIRSPEDLLRRLDKVSLCYADYTSKEEMLKAVLKCERLEYATDDYPLPWQLQKRCNEFTQRCFNGGQHEWFKESAGKFNTMNAFFRSQMRAGKI